MTSPKHVSSSLKNLLDNPIVKTILDRSIMIMPAADEVKSWWGYDLMNRRPSPAYSSDGVFTGTDLDLACFLYELAGRGAVINIPVYKAATVSRQRVDQELSSSYNRHGQLIGVVSNQNFFKFNISVIDQNVVGEDKVGDYRTFSITNENGDWYEGWREIQFSPTLKENRFLTENKLWTDNKVIFKNFIHPNRWTSFFGQYYVITKMMINRLVEESAFLNTEVKRLQALNIQFPEGAGPTSYMYLPPTGDRGVSKKFVAFEAKIFIPKSKFIGKYPAVVETQEGLVSAYEGRKEINRILNGLRFMTRATEYAHYINPDRIPAWLKNVEWEEGFVEPGKRTKWDRMKLFQDAVGEHSISILKRVYTKSAIVAE